MTHPTSRFLLGGLALCGLLLALLPSELIQAENLVVGVDYHAINEEFGRGSFLSDYNGGSQGDLSFMDLTQPQYLEFTDTIGAATITLTTDDGTVFQTANPVNLGIDASINRRIWVARVVLVGQGPNGAGKTIVLDIDTDEVAWPPNAPVSSGGPVDIRLVFDEQWVDLSAIVFTPTPPAPEPPQALGGATFVPDIRARVNEQLREIANAGASVISTRLWQIDDPGTHFPETDARSRSRLTFPLSTDELANIQAYVEDVASTRADDGRLLDLELALLWQGCSDYRQDDGVTIGFLDDNADGNNDCAHQEWDTAGINSFVPNAQASIDGLLNSVSNIRRDEPPYDKVVKLIYLQGEVELRIPVDLSAVKFGGQPLGSTYFGSSVGDLSFMDLNQPQNLSFAGTANAATVTLTTDDGTIFEPDDPLDLAAPTWTAARLVGQGPNGFGKIISLLIDTAVVTDTPPGINDAVAGGPVDIKAVFLGNAADLSAVRFNGEPLGSGEILETGTDLSFMNLTQPQNLSFSGEANSVEVKLTTDDGTVFGTLSPVDFTTTITNPNGDEEQLWFTTVTLVEGAGKTIDLEILTRHVETDGAVAAGGPVDINPAFSGRRNERRFLTDLLPYFMRETDLHDIQGSIYFLAQGDEWKIFSQKDYLPRYWGAHRGALRTVMPSVVFVNDIINPMNYYLPRLDFSFYPDVADLADTSFQEMVSQLFDDIEARFIHKQPVGFAETVYPLDDDERVLLGQAYLKEAIDRDMLKRVNIWTTPCGARPAPGDPADPECYGNLTRVGVPLDLNAYLVPRVGDDDYFTEIDEPVDVPPQSEAARTMLEALGALGPGEEPRLLDEGGRDRAVGLTHFFSLPPDALITAATVRTRVRAEAELARNDVILYEQVGPPFIALRDLLGRELDVVGDIEDVEIDLGKVPVRLGPFADPGESLSPYPDEYVNLLGSLFDGQFDMVFADDVAVDFSELSITYVLPGAPKGDLTGDGQVDRDDLDIVVAARNTEAYGENDPRDLDEDGYITVVDARHLVSCIWTGCPSP